MPTQNTRSQIARKVNFAIQLLREAAELVEASPKAMSTQRPRYTRRSTERDE
jgi:sensor domain CHASE-containing protein